MIGTIGGGFTIIPYPDPTDRIFDRFIPSGPFIRIFIEPGFLRAFSFFVHKVGQLTTTKSPKKRNRWEPTAIWGRRQNTFRVKIPVCREINSPGRKLNVARRLIGAPRKTTAGAGIGGREADCETPCKLINMNVFFLIFTIFKVIHSRR